MTIPTTTCGHIPTNKRQETVSGFYKTELNQKYDNRHQADIFGLDNVSIHKSNKVKETLARVPSKNTVSISSN